MDTKATPFDPDVIFEILQNFEGRVQSHAVKLYNELPLTKAAFGSLTKGEAAMEPVFVRVSTDFHVEYIDTENKLADFMVELVTEHTSKTTYELERTLHLLAVRQKSPTPVLANITDWKHRFCRVALCRDNPDGAMGTLVSSLEIFTPKDHE